MEVRQGDVFKEFTDGVNFIVKKIANDLVVLQSQDGKRQILTGVHSLTSTSFYLKKAEKES